MENYSVLNNYLVNFFNGILKIEENSLQTICSELSLKEIHTIEAIVNSDDKSVGNIAAKLKVTTGTLSVALKTLENKGYIVREKGETDRRQVSVSVTGKGVEVNRRHQEFHHNMVSELIACLCVKELDILMVGLDKLNLHFTSIDKAGLVSKEPDLKV